MPEPAVWFIWVQAFDRVTPQIIHDPKCFIDEGIRGRVVAKHPVESKQPLSINFLRGRFPAPPLPKDDD